MTRNPQGAILRKVFKFFGTFSPAQPLLSPRCACPYGTVLGPVPQFGNLLGSRDRERYGGTERGQQVFGAHVWFRCRGGDMASLVSTHGSVSAKGEVEGGLDGRFDFCSGEALGCFCNSV